MKLTAHLSGYEYTPRKTVKPTFFSFLQFSQTESMELA